LGWSVRIGAGQKHVVNEVLSSFSPGGISGPDEGTIPNWSGAAISPAHSPRSLDARRLCVAKLNLIRSCSLAPPPDGGRENFLLGMEARAFPGPLLDRKFL